MKTAIQTNKAPLAIGPYSQGIVSDGLIFISGQLPLIPEEGTLAEGIENQTNQVLKNLQNILDSQGLNLSNVIKTTIFLTDLSHFKTVNEVYMNYFEDPYPARSTVQVAALPLGAPIEIEAIARS